MPSLIVYDEPVAKARARVAVRNGKPHAYTPAKTVQAEWRIRTEWIAKHGLVPLEGPLELDVIVVVPMPKSIPKKRQAEAQPTKRPDIDNYIKTCLDSLNGVAWKDDSQVVILRSLKRYPHHGGPSYWDITVKPWGQGEAWMGASSPPSPLPD